MSRGTFRVLLAWVLGELFVDPDVGDELSDAKVEAFQSAAVRRRRAFALVVRRNWRIERAIRGLDLPPELQEWDTLPEGAAVDRLIGYQDGKRFVRGLAGLEPQESMALRYRRLEFVTTDDACRWLRCKPSAYYKFVSEARRKLREFFGLEEGKMRAGGPTVSTGAPVPPEDSWNVHRRGAHRPPRRQRPEGTEQLPPGHVEINGSQVEGELGLSGS